MTKMKTTGGAVLTGLLVLGAAAHAQTSPIQTIPGLENFSIERPRLAPQPTPQPTPAPTPTPTSSPRAGATAVPVPPGSPIVVFPTTRATPRATTAAASPARLTPEPVPAPVPAPRPSAVPAPAAAPTAVVAPIPTPVAPVVPATVEPVGQGGPIWPWLLGAVLVALGVAAAVMLQRRRPLGKAIEEAPQPAPLQTPVSKPLKPAPAPTPPAPAIAPARLAIGLRPLRAGLNLLTATAECEVTVVNAGDRPASDVRVGLRLLSAGIGQEGELAAVFAAPIGRPIAPPFALKPGEERRVRGFAVLSRDAIRALEAGGRPMFVPMVAVDLRYAWDGAPAQTAQAFAVGIERTDSAKLAPLWLDVPARMHDAVAARPHAAPLER